MLSLLSILCTALSASMVSAQGIVQMAAVAKQLSAASAGLSGGFTMSNVATGQVLTWDGQQSIFPSKGNPADLTLYKGKDGIRISVDSNKCLSAQWGGDFDWAAVLYACQQGPGNSGGGLEPAKQWWLLVPAGNGGLTPVSASKAKPKAKAHKSKAKKHRGHAHGHHRRGHHHEHHKRDEVEDFAFANSTLLEKRHGAGVYYVIPTDHVEDMNTRALSSSSIKTGGQTSTVLAPYKKGDPRQQWLFTPN